jgi:hypothetical protein
MPPTYTDEDARQALLDRRGHLVRNIFQGTKLEFGNTFLASTVLFSAKNSYTIAKEIKALSGGGISAAAAPSATNNLINGVFNVDNLNSFVAQVGVPSGVTQSIEHFLSVIPGVASVQSGLAAILNLTKAASHAWNHYQVEQKTGIFRCGDARAAIGAVREVIQRAKNVNESKAIIQFSHAAASAGGFFIDGGAFSGPAAAALKAFATLTYRMYLLGRDMKEKYQANKLLKSPSTVDANIFRKSPVLGCYLITEGSAFDILNFLVSEIGQDNWMSKVDTLLPDMTYVQDLAAQYAREASLQLSGLKTDMWNFRGLTRMERLKRWLKKKVSR